jgi:hypothetical protein
VPAEVTTSLQLANYCYPDADSLAPTRVVCVMGSAVTGGARVSSALCEHHVSQLSPLPLHSLTWHAGPASFCTGRALSFADVRQVLTGRVRPQELSEAWLLQAAYEVSGVGCCGSAVARGLCLLTLVPSQPCPPPPAPQRPTAGMLLWTATA